MTASVLPRAAYGLCARCGHHTEYGYICEWCAFTSVDVRARNIDDRRAQDASAISRIQQRQVDIGGAYAQWSSLVSVLDSDVVSADDLSRSSLRHHRLNHDAAISRRVRQMSYRASEGVANLGKFMKAPDPLPFNGYPGARSARR